MPNIKQPPLTHVRLNCVLGGKNCAMTYKDEIINVLCNHKNGLEVGEVACEVLGEQWPGGVYNPNFIFVLKDVLELAKTKQINSKDYAPDIKIVGIGEIPDE